jgi:hypothetical protein
MSMDRNRQFTRGDKIARRGCLLTVLLLVSLEVWGIVTLYRIIQAA